MWHELSVYVPVADLCRLIQDYLTNPLLTNNTLQKINERAVWYMGGYPNEDCRVLQLVLSVVVNSVSPQFTIGFWMDKTASVTVRVEEKHRISDYESQILPEGYHNVADLTFSNGPYKNFTQLYEDLHPNNTLETFGKGPGAVDSIFVKGPTKWHYYYTEVRQMRIRTLAERVRPK
jgi:hypothetical protein